MSAMNNGSFCVMDVVNVYVGRSPFLYQAKKKKKKKNERDQLCIGVPMVCIATGL